MNNNNNKNITRNQWNYIIANYFTGYYAHNQTLQQRKTQRALYLANQEYLQSYGPNKKASLYNKWYIPQYNIGVINSKGSNILPN
tara:strand:+ start:882 stop:1136 length:255 start_codon:yes stop_codon:yes gene_type:complete